MLASPVAAPADHNVVELLSTGPGPDGGQTPFNPFSSPDGKRVLFTTDAALVPGDTDNCDLPEFEQVRPCYDGYERFGGATSLLTTGPTDPHGSNDMRIDAASRDATHALFESVEPFVPEDTNGQLDVYERHAGTTTLVSTGPSGPGTSSSSLRGVSDDGQRVFFSTFNGLVAEDGDNCSDLYERSAGTTKLVSIGVPATAPCPSLTWLGSSADGSRVFAATQARVTNEDTDDDRDIYEWSNGNVTLVSTGPGDGPGGGFVGGGSQDVLISRDGGHVFFRTTEQLVAGDTDSEFDQYERFGSVTRLLVPPVSGDSSPVGFFNGMTEDGSRVFFSTSVGLMPEDTDGASDLYKRTGDTIELVSTGPLGSPGSGHWAGPLIFDNPFGGVSADGDAVLFASSDPFVPEDTDNVQDIYLRANGETTLISTGSNDVGRSFLARVGEVILTADGSRVFFVTDDPLCCRGHRPAHRRVRVARGPDDVGAAWRTDAAACRPGGPQARSFVHDGSRVFIQTDSP